MASMELNCGKLIGSSCVVGSQAVELEQLARAHAEILDLREVHVGLDDVLDLRRARARGSRRRRTRESLKEAFDPGVHHRPNDVAAHLEIADRPAGAPSCCASRRGVERRRVRRMRSRSWSDVSFSICWRSAEASFDPGRTANNRSRETHARHHAQPAEERLRHSCKLMVGVQPERAVLRQRDSGCRKARSQESRPSSCSCSKPPLFPSGQVRACRGSDIGQPLGGVEEIVELRAGRRRWRQTSADDT